MPANSHTKATTLFFKYFISFATDALTTTYVKIIYEVVSTLQHKDRIESAEATSLMKVVFT